MDFFESDVQNNDENISFCDDDFDLNNYDQDDIDFFDKQTKINNQIQDVEKLTDDEFFDRQFEFEEKQKIEKVIKRVKDLQSK